MSKFVGGIACFVASFALVGLLVTLMNTQFFGTTVTLGGGPDPFLVGVILAFILATAVVLVFIGNKLLRDAEREALAREAREAGAREYGVTPQFMDQLERDSQRARFRAAATFFAEGELPMRLRAEGWSQEDAAWFALFYQQGATFNGGVTLPSGLFLTGEQVYQVIGPPSPPPSPG